MNTGKGHALAVLLAMAAVACGSDPVAVTGGNDVAAQGDSASDQGVSSDGNAVSDATPGSDTESVDVPAVDVPPPACSAAQLQACDDGLACTDDACAMPGGVCKWTLKADTCLVGGVCKDAGEAKAGDPCRMCDAAKNANGWTLAGDGGKCDDGKPCTYGDSCAAGKCAGQTLVCGDENPCTSDVCDPAKGCTYPALSGPACSDANACTSGDTCAVGLCTGATVSCDDSNLCTNDSCDLAAGCTHTDNSAPCSDGDARTVDDTCGKGACVAGAPINCDDGNTCTIDVEDKAIGCYHLPTKSPCCVGQTSICDDGNPCTSDDCAAGGGCNHKDNTAICDDGNACTSGDLCGGGVCKGKAKLCDDKNPCTTDSCSTQTGCAFTLMAGGPCDDGDLCTSSDSCVAGACKGSGQCACTPAFAKQASKLTAIEVGSGGKPGQGLDVDANNKTCSPAGNCSGGIDNAFGGMAGLLNGQLGKAVEAGSVVLVLEYKDFKQGPINVALYQASLDPANATCDVQKQSCAYLASKSMLDILCAPVVAMAGTLAGNTLVAGGKGTKFPFVLPIGGANLEITIEDVQMQGTVTIQNGVVTSLDAILAGAVPKAGLMAAIDAAPEGVFPAGLDKATIKGLLDATVIADIDTNGDGKPEAASIGFKIKGIAGTISGTK